jgi:cell division septation protein DedD
MAKKFDPKAKAKRQKLIAIGGAILLVVILVVELPGVLKGLNPPRTDTLPVSTTPTPTGAAPAGTLAPPTLAGPATPSSPAAAAPATGQLGATDTPASASSLKLVSFSLFVSKDPFRQQVNTSGQTGTGTTPTTPPKPPTPPTTPTTPTPPKPPKPPPTSAVISVNGTPETVTVGKTFPAPPQQPFFQLVAITPTSVKIGIAGGSLTNGQNTVTVPVGKTITLMNTADGTRYTLKVDSVS